MKPGESLSWLLILAAAGSGCALIDPTDPFRSAPIADAVPGEGGIARRAVHAVHGPLSLEEAVRVALANNPGLAAAAHEADAASARRDEAAALRWPTLRASGAYGHHLDPQRMGAASGNGEPGVFGRDLFAGDLAISMPVFTGGRITSEIEAARLLEMAARHGLARTRDELVFNVSSVFFGILAQRKAIESLEFSRTALQEQLKRVTNLMEARKAAMVDRLRTEVRLADIEQRLAQQRNALSFQTRFLANLLGLDEQEKPLNPAGELSRPGAAAQTLNQVLARALSRRPDYLGARAAVASQARTVDAARAGHWPAVSLQGTYGWRWAANPVERQAGTPEGKDAGHVGIAVDIPLFEGGRVEARVRREKARLLAAREGLRRLELQIRLEVETAVLNLESARLRADVTEKAIGQAAESLRIEREKYDMGKGAIADVLDAQSALLESQTAHIRALADCNVAMAQLKLAAGDQ